MELRTFVGLHWVRREENDREESELQLISLIVSFQILVSEYELYLVAPFLPASYTYTLTHTQLVADHL